MKKKALVLATYMACASPSISSAKALSYDFNGLNLGEVKSKSSLGEPLKGIIPILFTSRQQARKLSVRLAPTSVYEKVGAEKTPELDYLDFRISTRGKKPVIVVSSDRAIQLPILNFILEIKSPNGLIYQDYTLMLDPPKHTIKQTKKQAKKHRKTSSKAARNKRSKKSIVKYKVRSGDTVSRIAKRFKPKGISLSKMIRTIHSTNPNAFAHNDINKIKRGAILSIPSSKKVKKIKHLSIHTKAQSKKSKSTKNKLIKINTYKVKKGDTLSKITKKFIIKKVSFTKMMRAIYKKNPHAFSHNKINQLKAGVRLRIPTYTEFTKKKTNKKVNHESTAIKNSAVNLPNTNKTTQHFTTTINNLQKRIRELRNELSSVKNNYHDLQEILSSNSTPEKIVIKPSIHKAITKPMALRDKPSSKLSPENIDPFDKYKNIVPLDDLTNDNLTEESSALELISSEVLNQGFLPESKQNTSNFLINNEKTAYGFFLILLAFGFIKYRKKTSYQTLYNTDKDKHHLKDNSFSFQDLLVESPKKIKNESDTILKTRINIKETAQNKEPQKNKSKYESLGTECTVTQKAMDTVTVESPIKQTEDSITDIDNIKVDKSTPVEISPEYLQECERLVDELTQDLSKKVNIPSNNIEEQLIFESACDQDVNTTLKIEEESNLKNGLDLRTDNSNKNLEKNKDMDQAVIEILDDNSWDRLLVN